MVGAGGVGQGAYPLPTLNIQANTTTSFVIYTPGSVTLVQTYDIYVSLLAYETRPVQ